MLKGTWARGMKSCTPRASLSSQTMPSVSQLNILILLTTVTLRCTTQAKANPSGSPASVSMVRLSALPMRHQASATSGSSHLSNHGLQNPTTMSLTQITTPTQSYTIAMRTICSICGSWPGLLPSLKNWAISFWTRLSLLFQTTHKATCSWMTKMSKNVDIESETRKTLSEASEQNILTLTDPNQITFNLNLHSYSSELL